VEEARQHPTLTTEKRLFLATFGIGLLSPLVGLALQLGFGGHFLLAGLIGLGMSCVAIEVWQWLRPELSRRRKHKAYAIFSTVVWVVVITISLFYLGSIA
jgi:hypothetical protein